MSGSQETWTMCASTGNFEKFFDFRNIFSPFTVVTYCKDTGKLSAQTHARLGVPIAATTITITDDQLDVAFAAIKQWANAIMAMER